MNKEDIQFVFEHLPNGFEEMFSYKNQDNIYVTRVRDKNSRDEKEYVVKIVKFTQEKEASDFEKRLKRFRKLSIIIANFGGVARLKSLNGLSSSIIFLKFGSSTVNVLPM